MTDNYKLLTISEKHYEHFDTFYIRYRVDIINELTIHDYYGIVNEIIELNKEGNIDIRINISMYDENNPRMNFKTPLLNINEITPNHLFDLVEMKSEDDDEFYISIATNFTVQKVRMSL